MNENNNPYAHQKIESKKLYVESNYVKEEEVSDLNVKAVSIFLGIVVVGLLIAAYFFWIYPSFIKSSYTIEEACNNPYECKDNGDGTKTCSFFDSRDKLQYVICGSVTSVATTEEAEE